MKSEESRSWNRSGPQRLDFLLSEMECLWKCWMKCTSNLPTILENIVCRVCNIGEVIEGWWINPFLKVGRKCLRRRLWKAWRKDIPSRGRAGLRGRVVWCFSMKCEDWPWTVLRLEKVHVCHSESLGFSPRMWWSHIESKGETWKQGSSRVICRKTAPLVKWRVSDGRASLGRRREVVVLVALAPASWGGRKRENQRVRLEGVCRSKSSELDLRAKRTLP